MHYQDFVLAVKAAYPHWTDLHRALDVGSEQVGSLLESMLNLSFSSQARKFHKLWAEVKKQKETQPT